jgi:hypothetical protein
MPPLPKQDELATGTRRFSPPSAPAPRGHEAAMASSSRWLGSQPASRRCCCGLAALLPPCRSILQRQAKRRHPTAPSDAAECPIWARTWPSTYSSPPAQIGGSVCFPEVERRSHRASRSGSLPLPKTSSMQLMPHAGTHEVPHRVGRVVECEGWRFGQEPRVVGSGWRGRALAMPWCARCPL